MSPSLQTLSTEPEELQVCKSKEGGNWRVQRGERERESPAENSEREGGDWLSIRESLWKIDSVSGVHGEDRALRRGGGELTHR